MTGWLLGVLLAVTWKTRTKKAVHASNVDDEKAIGWCKGRQEEQALLTHVSFPGMIRQH